MIDLGIKLTSTDAKMPTRAYKGDVGIDCYSCQSATIHPNSVAEIILGISLDIPEGHWVGIYTRSSYAKRGLLAHHGIIDSGYKGSIVCFLFNPTNKTQHIKKGDKVCQLITHKIIEDGIEAINTEKRGTNGYGSSDNAK